MPTTQAQLRTTDQAAESARVARFLNHFIYLSLLTIIVLTAIPYGTVQPWWRAIFECLIFVIGAIAVVEAAVTKQWSIELSLVTPLVLLCVFGLCQSWSWFSGPAPMYPPAALSADPHGTRAVVYELFALSVTLVLLLRYMSTPARKSALIYLLIGVGVASALFGILLKNFQQAPGFFLPALPMDGRGFGQFINRNHFAFLVEMSLGLALGLLVATGNRARRRRVMLLPVVALLFTALIYSNSRGGIMASLCELLFLGVLIDPVRQLIKPYANTKWQRFQEFAGGWAVRVFLLACLIGLFAYGVSWVGGESTVSNLQNAAMDFSQQGMSNNDNTSREKIWGATWQLIRAHPIAGIGLGGYWMAITRYHQASGELTPQQAHNDYLELIASVGLIGGLDFNPENFRCLRSRAAR